MLECHQCTYNKETTQNSCYKSIEYKAKHIQDYVPFWWTQGWPIDACINILDLESDIKDQKWNLIPTWFRE